MLLVQEFLKTKSFADLIREHGVYASFSKSGYKFSLNYDQLETKDSDLLAQDCRGLILSSIDGKQFPYKEVNAKRVYDETIPGETIVIARPMQRFFNYGAGSAYVDWNDPKLTIMEKCDGTLIIVSYDPFDNKWHASTRRSPESDIIMDNGIFTFKTLFEKALKETTNLSFEEYTNTLDKEFTYCFELTCPLNRVHVIYNDYKVTLLAVRNTQTSQEIDIDDIPIVPKVHKYPISTIPELIAFVSSKKPTEHEGVIVRDSNFNRIKIKNPAYVASVRIKESVQASPRNMMEIILLEQDDDVLPHLPIEMAEILIKTKEGVKNIIHKYDELFNKFRDLPRKEFALSITSDKSLWSPPFFHMHSKNVNMKEFINNARNNGSYSVSFLDKMIEISK